MERFDAEMASGIQSRGSEGSRNVSVVVPVFNSAAIVGELVGRLGVTLPNICEQYEVILVDDGSSDGSWEVISQVANVHDWVRGIGLMRNYGQQNALLCGIRDARYELLITMDDDLQHPPEEVPKLLEKLEEGYDVVYGTPVAEKRDIWRKSAARLTKMALRRTMEADIARSVTSFRAFRTELREAFSAYRSPFVSIDVLLSWGTTRFAAVQVAHNPRLAGRSHYTFGKLIVHAVNLLTGFSTLPLQLASIVGFAFTLFGIALLVYVVTVHFVVGRVVPGFAFLASSIAIFSGAILFALGVIGEYLARMHFRLMERPTYVIHRETDSCKKEE